MNDVAVRALSESDPLADPAMARALGSQYFIFDAYVGGERRVDVSPLVLSPAAHRGAVRAAQDVWRVVSGVAAKAHTDEGERVAYGLSTTVDRLAAAAYAAGDAASLVRVDLLLGVDGVWRACEINADCPGGQNEALGLPALARAAGFVTGYNPTRVVDAFADRVAALAARPGAPAGGVALVYATAYAEDLQVCALLRRAFAERGVQAVLAPPTAPRRGPCGSIRVGTTPINTLYRFFPSEHMHGQANVDAVVDAIGSGALATVTSFAHIYAQTKLSFARAWAYAPSLDEPSRAALFAHVAETVDVADLSPGALVADRAGWVVKKAFGRVGDEVFVGALCTTEEWLLLVDEVTRRRASGEVWVAQRFVPQRPVPTPWGDRLVTLGAYLLDGIFVGYFARLTVVSHCSHDALCVPVFVEGAS